MKYISGIHALNLNCELETTGDWHQSALDWTNIQMKESNGSVFGNWGIEQNKAIPNSSRRYAVANHIRAILDMLEDSDFSNARGFRHDYICNEMYNETVFQLVSKLRESENWHAIAKFMEREYMMQWVRWMEKNHMYTYTDNDESVAHVNWQRHIGIMKQFLAFSSGNGASEFVLKGGAALMVRYRSPRTSDNIDLDGTDWHLDKLVIPFCSSRGYSYRLEKDTNAKVRYTISYSNDEYSKPLVIEASYTRKAILKTDLCNRITNALGFPVYNIDRLMNLKLSAYHGRDNVRDLYDIIFMFIKYRHHLSVETTARLVDIMESKGLEHIEWLLHTQRDSLIDTDELQNSVIKLWYDLSLM